MNYKDGDYRQRRAAIEQRHGHTHIAEIVHIGADGSVFFNGSRFGSLVDCVFLRDPVKAGTSVLHPVWYFKPAMIALNVMIALISYSTCRGEGK